MTSEAITTMQVFYNLFSAIVVSGVSVTIAVEILKSKFIPVEFQKYPRVTALVASIIASIAAVAYSPINQIAIDTPIEWVSVVAGTLLVSAFTYNNIFKTDKPTYK